MRNHTLSPLRCFSIALALALSVTFGFSQDAKEEKVIRVGIVGLDTSHVPAFTRLFNSNKDNNEDLAGIRVVVGYPGGTEMPASKNRVQKFTDGLRAAGVEIVQTIPKLLEKVDAVLLESVDGRIHLEEAKQIIPSGKPVFIDKPLARNLAESIAIFELAKKHKTPIFTSSSTRFGQGLVAALADKDGVGDVIGATTWGPSSNSDDDMPDLFFYGIHGVEALFTAMGTGCESVSRVKTASHDQVTGLWEGDRLGSYIGIHRGKASFGVTVYGKESVVQLAESPNYADLCIAIARFFKTGVPPVSEAETLEVLAFMQAADVSKARDGVSVSLAEVLEQAKKDAAELVK